MQHAIAQDPPPALDEPSIRSRVDVLTFVLDRRREEQRTICRRRDGRQRSTPSDEGGDDEGRWRGGDEGGDDEERWRGGDEGGVDEGRWRGGDDGGDDAGRLPRARLPTNRAEISHELSDSRQNVK